VSDTALQHALEAALARNPDQPAWLQALRSEALQRFDAAGGLPTTREEDWKYTDLGDYAERLLAYAASETARHEPATAETQIDICSAARIDFRNGVADTLPASPDGVRLRRFADLTGDEQTAVATELLDERPHAGITDLATAFVTDGLLIEIEAGTRVPAPLLLSFDTDGPNASAQPVLMLRLAAQSEAEIILHYRSDGAASVHTVLLADCGVGSRLDILRLQEESADTHHLAAHQLRLARDSRLNLSLVDFGGALVRHDLRVALAEPGAEAQLRGLFIANGEGHIDYHTRLDHAAPHTHSSEIVRGIAGDHGRGIFNGKIVVHEGADGTDAGMSNRNLLLSPRAEIDTKPELEIYADDVKCAHGATTGQLDDAALFYLRSRGIDRDSARRILVAAFAGEIIDALQPEALREYLLTQLAIKLGGELPEKPQ
jgi:Fe-S cluster assembly protein SufD